MTPKEKAEQLIKMFQFETEINEILVKFNTHKSKECALIAVDEILKNFGTLTEGKQHYAAHCTIKYYEEVKQEIEKL